MASRNVFIEEAAALRDDLASVLRSQPPASLEELDDLEFTLVSTADLESSLLASGLEEARSIAESIGRIRTALFSIRDDAFRSDAVRSQAVRSLLRRLPAPPGDPDPTLVLVAVSVVDPLPLDARVLVESGGVCRGGHGGRVTSLPRWVLTALTDDSLESAGVEEVSDLGLFEDREVREIALALWDPASDLPLHSFATALDTAARVV